MQDDLEPQAAMHVGQLVFAFARLDYMLALALRNLFSQTSDLTPLIERLGFKERLDSLQDLVVQSKSLRPIAVQQFATWYKKADRIRQTRNAFVHGRWGMQTRSTVFNASTKASKILSGDAKIYSLVELEAEANFAKQILSEFHEWHNHNVLVQPSP